MSTLCSEIHRHLKVNSVTRCHGEPRKKLHESPGMDLTSQSMYDTFKDEIWKELGPLDPDWFDVLTAQTFTDEGSVSDQDDLCANQEGNFKTPLDKTAVDSQLFSTPRVFRHGRVVSPDTEDDQWVNQHQDKETLPWTTTQSPYLLWTPKEGVPCAKYGGTEPQSQNSFDLLHTPQKSPVNYAKHISESLGAEIHPDISWTSSLNTPPAVPSTLILSKTDESPCPVSVSADKNVVFVRKLFPSLSNASRVGIVSPKNTDMPAPHKGALSPEAGQNPHDSPQSSLSQCEGIWRQKLPDAIEDGEIRSTVTSVLEGAENVLSIFFTNSSSALRKVKTDSNKRKLINPIEEHDCSSTDISTTNNVASSQQRTNDQDPLKCSSFPQSRNGVTGITEWSPLSLSKIPPSSVDTSCQENNPATQMDNKILTEQLPSDADSGQLVKTPLSITDSGFTKKRRKFIYTVDTSKTHFQGKEIQSQKRDTSQRIPDFGREVSVKKLEKTQDEANLCSNWENEMQRQENVSDKNLPPSVQVKVQDLDMSQLCRDFAEDFSQMSDHSKLSKVVEDTPLNGFSPSACLSAMKRAKQKARQANSHQDGDGISNRKLVSANNQNVSVSEVSDSGFQSAVVDSTHVTTTSFVLLHSEKNSQSVSGFKTDTHRTPSFLPTDKESQITLLVDILQETDASAIKESKTLDPDKELHKESTLVQFSSSEKETVDNNDCVLLSGQVNGNLPEKTSFSPPSIHASGFKTASNKGIRISSANLKRAKHLLEESERSFTDQFNKSAHDSKEEISVSQGSIKNTVSMSPNQSPSSKTFVDVSCQLTASQKADVTELCTLLEEADSQFEFTQFKAVKEKQHCQDSATPLQRVDKDLDPDFLMGIDFDDSFSSNADKHPEITDKISSVSDGKTNYETSKVTNKSLGTSLSSALRKDNSSTEDASSSSKHLSEGSSSITSSEPQNVDQAGCTEINKQENKNHLMPCAGFRTAGGNVLRVSEMHLNKARALFEDIEKNMTYQNSPKQSRENAGKTEQAQIISIRDKDVTKSFENNKMDKTTCQSGFQMASGKGISVSAKDVREADLFFRGCSVVENNPGMSVKQESIEPLPGSVNHKKNLLYSKNIQEFKDNLTEEPVREFETCTAGPATHLSNVVQNNMEICSLGFKNMSAFTNSVSFNVNPSVTVKALPSPSCAPSKNIGFFAIDALGNNGGFCTASGKKVSVSEDALKKAESLLNEIHTLDKTNKQLQQKGDALRTGHLNKQIHAAPLKNGGFQTASGRGVVISSAALKKAKSLLSECEAVEENVCVKPTRFQFPVPGPPHRSSGFLAANDEPEALSAEALQKAKAPFSDISCSAEMPVVSDTSSDKNNDNVEKTEKIHCGFMTAGGATVHVSQKNLLKAKKLLKEFDHSVSAKTIQDTHFFDCDFMDSNNDMSVKYDTSVALVSESGSEKKNLSNFKSDQRVAMNTPDPGSAELENANLGPVVNHENVPLLDDVESNKGVFKNSLLSTFYAASIHGNPSLTAKPLSSPLSTTSKSICSSAFNEFSSGGGGFCTASGKKVSVSDDAMTKAKSLLNDGAALKDTCKQLKHNEGSLPLQSGGFQTASGKGVAVSAAALEKAKTLLSECEGINDKIGVKLTNSKMPVPGQPPGNSGFHATSEKPVAFSSEALKRAESLCSDISFSAEIPAVSETGKSDRCEGAQKSTKEIHCGFTTAGGAKVHVSQKGLLKAKNLLKEFADQACHDSKSYSTSPHDTQKSDLAKVKDVKRSSNFTTGTDKDRSAESAPYVDKLCPALQETDHEDETLQNASVGCCNSIQRKTPKNAFKCKEDKITPSVMESCHNSSGEEMTSVLACEINQTSSKVGHNLKMTESSVLIVQSLNLSGCTETEQKFLAQEALDCTKALLEDEGLAGQSLSVTLENVTLQDNPKFSNKSVEEQKGRRKRAIEDAAVTGQPPLKRRLLEEFDRSVDGPRGSTLHPEKTCPKSVMNDRRVFRYNDSLHLNITRPHRNVKNYAESRMQKIPTQHSTPEVNRSAHSKMSVFVPPFHKKAVTETCKNTVLKNNTRTPAFIPPFKKQRTIVQESSSKAWEDQHHQPFATTSNSNTYIPPTKKTQSTTDVTDNKSERDTQTTALADTTNDNLMDNQNRPVGCRSEDFSAEAPCTEETLSRSKDIFPNLENLELARDMQDMRIRKKKRQTIRPLPGSLFLTKTSGLSRISLKDAVNRKPPARCTPKQLYGRGVQQHVSEITSETAETFRFSLPQFLKQEAFLDSGGVQLADGGWLITSNDGSAGKEEFYRALCDSPGVDPKLISQEWVYNHYRWIVWKQASMERSFPEIMGSLCLTPEQVLLQLKYRYDVEVDNSRRPALRKIMERDDAAAKTLVLCVCGVVSRGHSLNKQSRNDTKTPQGADAKVENPSAVVWLTDGWYAIKAQLDEPLTAMLHNGRLAVGGKLIIHGAQLMGSQDACSPLEAPESLMLKICANSSRPACWDTKLGFYRDPRPFLLPVSCLYSNGGPVGCVDIIVLRSYPIQWMERKPDGGVVFRSDRAEDKEVRQYNSQKQKAIEILFAKIEAEFEKEKCNNKPQHRRRTVSRQDIASLHDGEELYEVVGDDPTYLDAYLSGEQLEALHTYRCSLMEKKQAELQDRYCRALKAEESEGSCPKRDVTPVWRLCIADSMDQSGRVYQLNLWRPSSDLQSVLKEGCRYKVFNLTTSHGKKRSGIETIQLTGTKKTQFQDLQASQEWLSACFQPRVSASFVDLQNPEFQPLCGEVDLTGCVISVIDVQGSSPAFYLADGRMNFVKVRCFSSLSQSGLEDVVKPHMLLALSNLQLRGQSTSPTPVVYAGDLTVFSTNPKEVHLQESLSQLRNLVQGHESFYLTAEEKLSHLVKSDGLISSPALQPLTPSSTPDRRQDTKTSVKCQQPVTSFGSRTPVSRNPSAPASSTEKDPRSLKRRRALDYLSHIPSPPALSHLGSGASPCVNKTFNPPRRSGMPSTLKTVQTPACKPINSPVENEWVNDEELAMIDTQALCAGDVNM